MENNPSVENHAASAREALDVVAEARELNAQRLRRPHRYWLMFGGIFAVFGLMPYFDGLPAVMRFIAPLALVLIIAIVAAWKQPTAVRKIRLSGRMALQLIAFAVIGGILAGLGRALYSEHGWWWMPLLTAIVLFALIAGLGPVMDRSWARQVSRVDR